MFIKLFNGIVLAMLACSTALFAQTTAFTYQGKLTDAGNSPTSSYEMRFQLFDASTGGNQVGATQTFPSVAVAGGVFTVNLDFGAAAFTSGGNRFLELAVRPAASTNPFTVLSPRQQLFSSPFAVLSSKATLADSAAVAGNSNQLGGQNPIFYQNAGNLNAGTLSDARLSTNVARLDAPNQTFTGTTTLGNLTLAPGGQITNARIENSSIDPAFAALSPTASAGQIYYNTAEKNLKIFDGAGWINIVPRRVTTFAGKADYVIGGLRIDCDSSVGQGNSTIRSVAFIKKLSSSRLRITYRDWIKVTIPFSANFFAEVNLTLNNAAIAPVPLTQKYDPTATSNISSNFQISREINLTGYADNLPAGNYTLETKYSANYNAGATGVSSWSCYKDYSGNPYFIEIEEVP